MDDYCLVVSTASSLVEADKISEILLERHLVACVQQMPIKSSYHWKGKIEKSEEILMLMKTQTSLFEKVETAIKANHSYEVPEIICLSIDNGLPTYLSWIKEETKNGKNQQP